MIKMKIKEIIISLIAVMIFAIPLYIDIYLQSFHQIRFDVIYKKR